MVSPGRDVTFEAADGLRLAGTIVGDDRDPPVLLLHGFGQSRGAWRGTADALADRGWRAVTLDLRGHGDSDHAADYQFADFEQDVLHVATSLGDRPAMIGASMGGILTLLVHHHHHVASCVGLVDVVPQFDLDAGRRVQEFMAAHVDGFDDLDTAAAAVRAYLPERRRSDGQGLLRNLREGDDGRLRWKWDPRFAEGVSWLSEVADDDLESVSRRMQQRMTDAARALDVPTLLVRGARSDFVTPEAAAAFADLVPGARVVDVAKAGHMVAGDRNDAFTEVVVEFLEQHHPVGPARN